MTLGLLKWGLLVGVATLLLALCLFADTSAVQVSRFFGPLLREIQAAIRDPDTQGMVVGCLVSYWVAFLVLEKRICSPQKNAENTEEGSRAHTSPRSSPLPAEAESEQTISTPYLRPLSGRSGEGGANAFLGFLRGHISRPTFWLIGFVFLVLLRYAFSYDAASSSTNALVLVAGAVISKGVGLWAGWVGSLKSEGQSLTSDGAEMGGETETRHLTPSLSPTEAERGSETARRMTWMLFLICALLVASALWQPEAGMQYQYRGLLRWSGPWDNPNIFGMLMGVGVVLAIGRAISGADKSTFQSLKSKAGQWWSWVSSAVLAIAAVVCGIGLVRSYSRGAWLGTACGLLYLAWQMINREIHELHETASPSPPGGRGERAGVRWALVRHQLQALSLSRIWRISRLRSVWLPILVILISVLVLAFWNFRHTDRLVARRAFSVGNVNDFSWRNRVAAWEGSLQMMAEKPWLGFGWNQTERVYDQFYRPAKVAEAAAIQMNDYLTLGTTLGAPALACFVIFIGLALSKGEARGPSVSRSSILHPSLLPLRLSLRHPRPAHRFLV